MPTCICTSRCSAFEPFFVVSDPICKMAPRRVVGRLSCPRKYDGNEQATHASNRNKPRPGEFQCNRNNVLEPVHWAAVGGAICHMRFERQEIAFDELPCRVVFLGQVLMDGLHISNARCHRAAKTLANALARLVHLYPFFRHSGSIRRNCGRNGVGAEQLWITIGDSAQNPVTPYPESRCLGRDPVVDQRRTR